MWWASVVAEGKCGGQVWWRRGNVVPAKKCGGEVWRANMAAAGKCGAVRRESYLKLPSAIKGGHLAIKSPINNKQVIFTYCQIVNMSVICIYKMKLCQVNKCL